MSDPVDHPDHYNAHPVCEAIDLCEELTFNLGNAVKYLWRAGQKDDAAEDMKKALWYLRRETERLAQAQRDFDDDMENLPRDSTLRSVGVPQSVLKLARLIVAHQATPPALREVLESLADTHAPGSDAVTILEHILKDTEAAPIL